MGIRYKRDALKEPNDLSVLFVDAGDPCVRVTKDQR